jgi:hypothetical protein
LAVNPNGKVNLVYRGREGHIHYRRWAGGGWGADERVPAPAAKNYHPHVVAGRQGAPQVVFVSQLGPSSADYVIAYTARSGKSWSAPVVISKEKGAQLPRIATDGTNTLHVIYNTFAATPPQILYTRFEGQAWTKPQVIGSGLFPDLAVDANGVVHVVWNDAAGISYTRREPNGAWRTPTRVSGGRKQQTPSLAADVLGNVHLTWQTRTKKGLVLTYGRLAADGQITITNRVEGDDLRLIFYPRIVADCTNCARLVFQGKFTDVGSEPWRVYQRSFDGLTWGPRARLDSPEMGSSNQVPEIHANGTTMAVGWWNSTTQEIYADVISIECGGTISPALKRVKTMRPIKPARKRKPAPRRSRARASVKKSPARKRVSTRPQAGTSSKKSAGRKSVAPGSRTGSARKRAARRRPPVRRAKK